MINDSNEFTEFEQWENNYEFFLVDSLGRIGMFSHGGFKLLPPSYASDRQKLEYFEIFFEDLQKLKGCSAIICPDLLSRVNPAEHYDFSGYVNGYAEYSQKGIYCFDNFVQKKDRSYFRVTLPQIELRLENLPAKVRDMLSPLRVNKASFRQQSLFPADIIDSI